MVTPQVKTVRKTAPAARSNPTARAASSELTRCSTTAMPLPSASDVIAARSAQPPSFEYVLDAGNLFLQVATLEIKSTVRLQDGKLRSVPVYCCRGICSESGDNYGAPRKRR
jgi:hypothetical protein